MEETDQKSSVPQTTIDDKIFNFAYIMAMRDATQQQAFPVANKKLLWEKADETVVAYRLLKGYINDILDKDKQEQDFYEIEKDIEKAVNEFIKTNGIKKVTKKDEPESIEDAVITFGNAQKLINMTAKYMFISAYQDSDKAKLFNQCHCPMDGIMVDKVAKIAGRLVDEGEEGLRASLENFAYKRPRAHDWAAKDEVRWSKLTLENRKPYEGFQKVVRALAEREGLSPLELDFCVWGSDGDER